MTYSPAAIAAYFDALGAREWERFDRTLGARVSVADLSGRQLELNREAARARGFASSVEAWHQLDICDLGSSTPRASMASWRSAGPSATSSNVATRRWPSAAV